MRFIKYLFYNVIVFIYITFAIMFVINNYNFLEWNMFDRFALLFISFAITFFIYLYEDFTDNSK